MSPNDPRDEWEMEREIVLSRVLDAPVERVLAAWTDPAQVVAWFGPEGFTLVSEEIDIRVGGLWRFVFTGPDGRAWDNRMVFRRIEPPRLIEFDHGPDRDGAPERFRVTVTFDSQSDGRTVLTLRQLHPTRAQRDAGVGFGAVAFGYQTLDKLARHLGG